MYLKPEDLILYTICGNGTESESLKTAEMNLKYSTRGHTLNRKLVSEL